MNYSYNGIGEVTATFAVQEAVSLPVGFLVKMSGSGEVGPCLNGDGFVGIVESCRAGCAAVQIGGCVQVYYTGSEPAVGYTKLVANGGGGVCVGEGREYLVLSVHDGMAEIML